MTQIIDVTMVIVCYMFYSVAYLEIVVGVAIWLLEIGDGVEGVIPSQSRGNFQDIGKAEGGEGWPSAPHPQYTTGFIQILCSCLWCFYTFSEILLQPPTVFISMPDHANHLLTNNSSSSGTYGPLIIQLLHVGIIPRIQHSAPPPASLVYPQANLSFCACPVWLLTAYTKCYRKSWMLGPGLQRNAVRQRCALSNHWSQWFRILVW